MTGGMPQKCYIYPVNSKFVLTVLLIGSSSDASPLINMCQSTPGCFLGTQMQSPQMNPGCISF